ncbi:hypothetical protein BGZ63DRAFT_379102 [Mariannaea sp. PMI_226]|nr:hypothetical protein BGZ63DRAFT_379102 [Mariannaea sp. PMI_226]
MAIMNYIAVTYCLVTIVLSVTSLAVHFRSRNLSLPMSPVVSILTTILPLAAFVITTTHPSLLRYSQASNGRIRRLAPFIIQTLQGLAVTILATLLFEGVVPSRGLDCAMETDWMDMFRAHDGDGIRRIQDSFDCCGFNSVKDRAYPFPHNAPSTCSETYGRSIPCRGPWRRAMQTFVGTELFIVLFVGLIQVVNLVLMTGGVAWHTGRRRESQTNGVSESQYLLPPPSGTDGETTRQGGQNQSYGSTNGFHEYMNGDDLEPEVEPSGINERNAWEVEE